MLKHRTGALTIAQSPEASHLNRHLVNNASVTAFLFCAFTATHAHCRPWSNSRISPPGRLIRSVRLTSQNENQPCTSSARQTVKTGSSRSLFSPACRRPWGPAHLRECDGTTPPHCWQLPLVVQEIFAHMDNAIVDRSAHAALAALRPRRPDMLQDRVIRKRSCCRRA